MWISNCPTLICWKVYSPHWIVLEPCKNKFIKHVLAYFWILNSIQLTYMSLLIVTLVSHCPVYCSFVVSFEIRSMRNWILLFFPPRLFRLFWTPHNSTWIFRISLSVSTKKAVGILLGITVTLKITWSITAILKILTELL